MTAASCRPPAISCFQGRGSGGLWVYAADTGKVLKVVETGSHIMAAPTTYAVNGEQYVAVQVGYGGTGIAEGPIPPSSAAVKYENANRIIAFKLGGGAVPAPAARARCAVRKAARTNGGRGGHQRRRGQVRRGMLPLPRAGTQRHPGSAPARCGAARRSSRTSCCRARCAPAGMERFDDILSEKDVDDIHAYLIDQSWVAYRAQEAAKHK